MDNFSQFLWSISYVMMQVIAVLICVMFFIVFLYLCFRTASIGWHKSKAEYLERLRKLKIGEPK